MSVRFCVVYVAYSSCKASKLLTTFIFSLEKWTLSKFVT